MGADLIAGRYRLEDRLGLGGMAEVWRATDAELDRPVALKLLAPEAERARFEREARSAAALDHPNLTRIYDFGEYQGRPFMVLEYLPGGTLQERLRPGQALPDGETHRIAADVAAGLAHAHERGLVHRDLKPANILFDAERRAKIADFGIARLGGDGTLTEAGTVLGTAAYISPEQAAGEPATPASDVYSLGVMLFRMLTGRLPFEAEAPLELAALHRTAPPPPVSKFRPDAPPRLEALAAAALVKNPAERPADGSAVLADLGGSPGAETDDTRVLPPAAPAPSPRGRVRRILPLALAIAVLGAAGAAAAVLLGSGSGTRAPTTAARATTHRSPTHSTPVVQAPATSTAATTTTRPTTSAATPTRPATTTAPAAPPPSPTTTAPTETTAPPTTTSGTGITVTVPSPR